MYKQEKKKEKEEKRKKEGNLLHFSHSEKANLFGNY